MSAATIKFDNLLTEAKFAFHAGDFAKAASLLRDAKAIGELEQRCAVDAEASHD